MKKSVGLILIVISLLFILTNLNNSKSKLLDNEPQIEITDPVYEYGILVDSFNLIHGIVKINNKEITIKISPTDFFILLI